jgi:type IV pilus assembly protein PilC
MSSTFAYKVRDREGKLIEGTLEGDSEALVVDKLKQMGYVPVSVNASGGAGLGKSVNLSIGGNKVKVRDVSIFSRQFATMINSGLPLVRSISILAEQSDSVPLRQVMLDTRQAIETGSSLSQALANHPRVFNRLYVSMVRAGETGGVLDKVLLQLAATLERQQDLKRRVKSAMTYPVAVLGLVMLIVMAMLLFVVPKFQTLFAEQHANLPLPTQLLVNASSFMRSFWYLVFGAVGTGVFFLKRWIRTTAGRNALDAFKLRMPLFGPLFRKAALARYARTLAVLLESGVNIIGSLEITGDTVSNQVYKNATIEVQNAVEVGETMSGPMARTSLFPPMLVQMVAVGEETGNVDEMLGKVADFYESEVSATVDGLTSMLEPILMGFLGAVVGGMVMALYLPMFDLVTHVK